MQAETHSKSNGIASITLIVAFVLTIFAYWNASQNGFIYDDQWQVVRNPLIQEPSLFKTALTSDVWAFRTGDFGVGSNYYRPVFTAWSILNFMIFELEPSGWHVANILLHLVVVWLVWKVLLKLNAAPAVAAAVTWIFAAHPAHVESVTWVAGSTDMLMAIFGLFAFLKWLDLRATPNAKGWLLALGSFFLAMGSKEVSIGLVFVILMTEWALRRESGEPKPFINGLKAAGPFFIVGLFFIGIRLMLLGKGVGAQQEIGWGGMILSTPQLWMFYLKQTFFPFDLSSAYTLRPISRDSMTMMNFWVPTVLGLVSAGFLVSMGKKKALWAFGASILFFLLIPAFYIKVFHVEHIVRDRYLYLPLLGAFLLLIDGLTSAFPKLNAANERGPLALASGLVAAVFAYLSMAYNPVWQSDATFWARGVQTDPSSSTAQMNFAEALRKEKKFREAIPTGIKATEIAPNMARTWTILGMTYRDAGNYSEAESALRKAIALKRDIQIAGENLGALLAQQGRTDEAIKVYLEMTAAAPGAKLKNEQSMAIVLFNAGRRDEALDVLESSKSELEKSRVPQLQRNWYFLGELYRTSERSAEAKDAYQKFLDRSSPTDPSMKGMRDQASAQLASM